MFSKPLCTCLICELLSWPCTPVFPWVHPCSFPMDSCTPTSSGHFSIMWGTAFSSQDCIFLCWGFSTLVHKNSSSQYENPNVLHWHFISFWVLVFSGYSGLLTMIHVTSFLQVLHSQQCLLGLAVASLPLSGLISCWRCQCPTGYTWFNSACGCFPTFSVCITWLSTPLSVVSYWLCVISF